MITEQLLKEKREKKAKNPTFTRTDNHKKPRLNPGWRKPKGIQNKMRLRKKGYKVSVKPGYGTPATLRHANKKGLSIITINNLAELDSLDPKTQGALIAGVGRKKKEALIAAAQAKKITIINLPVKAYQERTKEFLKAKEDKKQHLVAKQAAKDKKAKDAEKAAAEKAAAEAKAAEEKTTEEKKQEEKLEQDKILTSKKGM